MKINKKVLAVSGLIFALYAVGKIFFNDADPSRGFNVATAQIYLAVSTLAILTMILFLRKRVLAIPTFGLFYLANVYYFAALLTAIYSNVFILTFYNAVVGLLYVLAAQTLAEAIYQAKSDFHLRVNLFIRFLAVLMLFMAASNVYFSYVHRGVNNFLTAGVEAGFSALLFLYLVFFKIVNTRSIIKQIILFVTFPISVVFNSISAIIAFSGVYTFSLITRRKWLQLLFVCATISIFIFYIYSILVAGVGSLILLNKPAEAYLTGSGRFAVYQTSVRVFVQEYSIYEVLFGVGFAAERTVLEGRGLAWITDPHNALILTLLGMGLCGTMIYMAFMIYPFIFWANVKRLKPHNTALVRATEMWIYLHVFFAIFSMTGSYYIGKPSLLLIISLTYFYLLYYEYKETKNGAKHCTQFLFIDGTTSNLRD